MGGLNVEARAVEPLLDRGPLTHAEHPEALKAFATTLVARRAEFEITRVGCITRLDRLGIPVVQVATPTSRSLAVSQGKGLTLEAAAVSAIMEAIEVWAAERIRTERCRLATAASIDGAEALYQGALRSAAADWTGAERPWIDGFDLFTGRLHPVPVALVDTLYTVPSPHPALFPRTTTGLGAGRSLAAAVVQAGLEILERDAVTAAHERVRFFERFRIAADSARKGRAAYLLDAIERAGFIVGLWRVPAAHDLPVVWCHIVEDGPAELAPLPAAGYACGLTQEAALCSAMLEACQARLAAISGAREDISRQAFFPEKEREALNAWKSFLREPGGIVLPEGADGSPPRPLERVIAALRSAGANAALVVPLYGDDESGIYAVRLVAPPLRHGNRVGL